MAAGPEGKEEPGCGSAQFPVSGALPVRRGLNCLCVRPKAGVNTNRGANRLGEGDTAEPARMHTHFS